MTADTERELIEALRGVQARLDTIAEHLASIEDFVVAYAEALAPEDEQPAPEPEPEPHPWETPREAPR